MANRRDQPPQRQSAKRKNWWPIRIHRELTLPLLHEVISRLNRAHETGRSQRLRRAEGVTPDDAVRRALKDLLAKWERSRKPRCSKGVKKPLAAKRAD